MKVRPFHRRFLRQVLRPEIDSCVLSLPRGNGKSTFADHIAARILHPDDVLFRKATESVVLASSLEQARIIYRACRGFLGDDPEFRWSDSLTRVQVVHKPTTLTVISSNTRAAFELVGTPYILADEPGAWQVVGGELLHYAIQTSIGKSGSSMRVMYFGTISPSTSGWWPDLVEDDSHGSVYVQALLGDVETWDSCGIPRARPIPDSGICRLPAQAPRRARCCAAGQPPQGAMPL